jgi:hypothetical protein
MRNSPLRAFAQKSPIHKEYDFTKKKEFGEGKIGKRIAKAVTPKSMVDMVPVGKVVKGAKAVYNYFKG